MSKVITALLDHLGDFLEMLKLSFKAAFFGLAGIFTAVEASAHEGAGIAHYATQIDHTLAISVTIGLVGFAILAWRQRAKKQS